MKKIAIISSYDEECGVAFYSKRLKHHFEKIKGFKVDVKRLNLFLLRARSKFIREKGDEHIQEIADSLKHYDAVCLQFEPGLYGTKHKTSYSRVLKLIMAHKNVILVVHGMHRIRTEGYLDVLQNMLKGSLYKGAVILYNKLIGAKEVRSFWKKLNTLDHVQVLTFCPVDKQVLKDYFNLVNVSDFPITYFTQEEINDYRHQFKRTDILKRYGLDEKKKYIGVFGFLGQYKGHAIILKAMEYLPDEYNLLVIGGKHPQSLEKNLLLNEYQAQLFQSVTSPENYLKSIQTAKKQSSLDKESLAVLMPGKPLVDKVLFIGQISDEEMVKFYSVIDFVVLPYILTGEGQSASGPATYAVEFGSRALFSNIPVFREMQNNYFSGAMKLVDSGSYLELARGIITYDNFKNELNVNQKLAVQKYNPVTMVNKYCELLKL